MSQGAMDTETCNNLLLNSSLSAANRSYTSASLTRTESNDNLTIFHHDNSRNISLYLEKPASRIFGRELIVIAATMLLCSAAASNLFVVPALGISMHTVASLWRRGMLGLIAFAVQFLLALIFLNLFGFNITFEVPIYLRLSWTALELLLLYFRHRLWQSIPTRRRRKAPARRLRRDTQTAV